MKLQTLQILQIFYRVQDNGRPRCTSIVRISEHSPFRVKITVGSLTSTYPSIHVETLKITVGCPPCTYPSIHRTPGAGTLKITVGCLTSTYPSIRNKNLHMCWTLWSTQETRGLRARPPVLSPVPVTSDPQPRWFELTLL